MKIHDYRKEKCNWYHNILIGSCFGTTIKCTGWGTGVQQGHIMILSCNHYDTWAVYIVDSIEYVNDPRDRFQAELKSAHGIVEKYKEEFEKVIGGIIACAQEN